VDLGFTAFGTGFICTLAMDDTWKILWRKTDTTNFGRHHGSALDWFLARSFIIGYFVNDTIL
jgi:hypothetical protein